MERFPILIKLRLQMLPNKSSVVEQKKKTHTLDVAHTPDIAHTLDIAPTCSSEQVHTLHCSLTYILLRAVIRTLIFQQAFHPLASSDPMCCIETHTAVYIIETHTADGFVSSAEQPLSGISKMSR